MILSDNSYKKEQEQIKKAIVKGYRRGVCTADGCHIPEERRGMAGKGSRFRTWNTSEFRENFDRIVWSKA